MTTAELAKLIGVSRVTVSKVINGAEGVSPRMREKVQKYIDFYGFEPNSQARSLVGKEEQIIGFFSAYSEANAGAGMISSHFATEMIHLVVDEAQRRDYKTLVSITEAARDTKAIERFFSSRLIRGAVLLGYETGNEEVKRLAEKGFPLVLVNQEKDTEFDNVSVVNMDDEQKAFDAVEKLVEFGHRDLIYLGCGRSRLPAMRRQKGVNAALQKYRGSIDSLLTLNGDFCEEKAYSQIYAVYSRHGKKPTGIFAANDIMAIGAMRALKALHYRIPEDVSIIGFDDISISKYLTPGLTTMRCDFRKIASAAVDALIGLIEEKGCRQHIELPVEFMMRGTLGPVSGREAEGLF